MLLVDRFRFPVLWGYPKPPGDVVHLKLARFVGMKFIHAAEMDVETIQVEPSADLR